MIPIEMSSAPPIPLPAPAYLANCRWIETQFDQLMQQYRDQWIAVDQGRVVATGPALGQVAAQARRIGASPDVAFEFMAGVSMIF